uniref:PLAT domain-containing protein n=1 Tax=uncultured marine virus TaxID=186617 RepID=A0A0F7L0Y9_9VIRU|nr:hypothetical protein [uncultured marine virus]
MTVILNGNNRQIPVNLFLNGFRLFADTVAVKAINYFDFTFFFPCNNWLGVAVMVN